MSIIKGFPKYLKSDVRVVLSHIGKMKYDKKSITYIIEGQSINMPISIFNLEVPADNLRELTKRQRLILHCVYSRHHDGYIREKHMKNILASDYEEWAIPYIVKISEEHVVEIVQLVYDQLRESDISRIRQFCANNVVPFATGYNRMVNFWNERHRWNHYHFKYYVGKKLFKQVYGYRRSIASYAVNKSL